jgi:hypothetical protein
MIRRNRQLELTPWLKMAGGAGLPTLQIGRLISNRTQTKTPHLNDESISTTGPKVPWKPFDAG